MTTPTNLFAFPKPTDTDSADLPTQLGNIVEQIEDRLSYAGASGGVSRIATDQTSGVTSYAVLGTPDRVSGLVLPDLSILRVMFYCEMKNSVASAGGAQIIAVRPSDAAEFNIGQGGIGAAATGSYSPLVSSREASGQQAGLVTPGAGSGFGFGSNIAPDPLVALVSDTVSVGLTSGTFNIEARFQRSSGTLNVRNRLLLAWVKPFPASGI